MGVSRIRDEWAQVSMRKGTLSAGAALRLLPGARFYNCHLGGHLLAFFHASYKDQAAVCNQQSAVIHGGLRSIIADRFPFASVDIKREGHRGGFGGLAVIAASFGCVRVVGSAGEINSSCFFFRRLGSSRAAIEAAYGVVCAQGNARAAVVAILHGDKDVQVGHGCSSALRAADAASEEEGLVVDRYRRGREASGHAGHATLLCPATSTRIHFVS